MEKIEQLIAVGDKQATLIADAMTYQISKKWQGLRRSGM